MGNIYTKMIRPLKNFNIENRAHRVISKDKPTQAPKYKSAVADLERILKENPEIVESLSKKDPSFDDRLKNVFVSTNDPVPPPRPVSSRYNPDKPLPQDKKQPGDFDYGIKEPEHVKPGFVTLRTVLKFMGDNYNDPEKYNADVIAKEYNLKHETVCDILEYYRVFELYIPVKKETSQGRFAQPTEKFKGFLGKKKEEPVEKVVGKIIEEKSN